MKELPKQKQKFTLRELELREISSIYPLIVEHNPGMSKALFTARLKQMLPLGYRVVAAFKGKHMIAISGFWLGVRFWCGRSLEIDNFIVSAAYRRSGVGGKIMVWLEAKAITERCELMGLDVYADSFLAHRFYHRHGFVMTGYHMTKVPGNTEPFKQLQKTQAKKN